MTTAQELIDGAAKLANVLAEAQTLEAGINADALNRLNRMLGRFRNNGIDFGLGILTPATTLFIDQADEEAVELQLAIRLARRHGRPISGETRLEADTAMTELQAKYSIVKEMNLDLALTRRKPYNIRTE